MSNRRNFLKKLGVVATVSAVKPSSYLPVNESDSKWATIKSLFLKDKTGIKNFNTGSAGIMPRPILESYQKHLQSLHSSAPYLISGNFVPAIDRSLKRLSAILDAGSGELALMRNTTSAINSVLFGTEWEAGDEVICSNVDYPLVHNTLDLVSKRYGVVIKKIELNLVEMGIETLLEKYKSAYTPQTRMVILTHMTHKEGQIMPVKQLIRQAHEHEAEVLLDGAHSAGQFQFSLEDLDCDYYATSLHKWMSAPLGTGLLYVKNSCINKLHPPLSYGATHQDKMSKFTFQGTVPFQNSMTLESVLDFLESVGLGAKEQRLKELHAYLRSGISDMDGVAIVTDEQASCGVCAFSIEGVHNRKLVKRFEEEHKIHLKYTSYGKNRGFLRISLNLHLDESDIDLLISAIRCFSQEN